MPHRTVIFDGYNQRCTRADHGPVLSRGVASVYVLTIVFLFSQVSITSLHASKEACEQAAERARQASIGPQAVASARCEPQVPSAK